MNAINNVNRAGLNKQVEINTEDIIIDIFSESMTKYVQKLNAASRGRYELDDYDMQVLAIAMEQYVDVLNKTC